VTAAAVLFHSHDFDEPAPDLQFLVLLIRQKPRRLPIVLVLLLNSARPFARPPAEGASGTDPQTRARVSCGDVRMLNGGSVLSIQYSVLAGKGHIRFAVPTKYEQSHCCSRTAFSYIALESISIVLGTGDVLRVTSQGVLHSHWRPSGKKNWRFR